MSVYKKREAPMVAALAEEHGLSTRGFKKALLAAIGGHHDEFVEMFRDEISWFRRVPDAYRIHDDDMSVVVLEVEATHRIPDAKMADYADLWFYLDCYGWTLMLMRATDVHSPVMWNLCDEWYRGLYERAAS